MNEGHTAPRGGDGAGACPAAPASDKRLDRNRRLTTGLMVVSTFACVVCVVAALLGWYDSLGAAAVPVLLFGAVAWAASRRLRSFG